MQILIDDGKIDSLDVADITIEAQTTGTPPTTGQSIGIINISAEQIDTIDGSADLEVQFDDKTSILIRDKINAGETGFRSCRY